MFAIGEHAFERVARGCPSRRHTLEGMSGSERQCPCCRLYYQGFRESGEVYRPALTTMGVCHECSHHTGDGDEVRFHRGRQHGRMLRHAVDAMRAKVTAANQRIIDKERELEARKTRVLVRVENLDKMIVATAHRERDEAVRRRDTAMGALSDVRLLHHQSGDNERRCSCGALYDKCEVAKIVDRWPGVRDWEDYQVRLAEQGERHRLHPNHPALSDPTWFLTHYEPHFEEQFDEPA